jgi:anti-sigma factor RsiW
MVLSQPCNEIIPLIDGYFDGELSATEKGVVQAHLSTCAECSERLSGISTLVDSLKSMPKLELTRDITEALPLPKAKVVALRPRVWAAVGVAAAVALLAVTVFNGSFMQAPTVAQKPGQPKPDSAPTPSPVAAAPQANPANSAVAVKPQTPKRQGTTFNGASQKIASHDVGGSAAGNSPKPAVTSANSPGSSTANHPPAVTANKNLGSDSRDSLEVAVVSDDGSLSDALGIATDEDGLYELKM